jgi:glycosyltransferase 2 family protein
MKKSLRSLLIKIAGSLLILYVLFRLIDFDGDTFAAVLKELRTGYYLLSLAGVVVVLAIKSFRWHRIIKNEGHHYPPAKAFGAYMASFTIGVITPGRIGEIARLYYLRQSCELSFLPAFRTIVTDRVFDLGVLVMLGLAALLHFSGMDGGNAYLAVLTGIVLFFAALFMGVVLLKWLLKSTAFRHLGFFQFVRDCLLQAVDRRALPLWLITLAAYLAFYLAIDLIFLSLGIEIRIIDIALVLSVVGLATILPISWAGFGTREISLVYLLAFYDIPAEVALSFSLLQFGAFFLWGSLIGLVFWLLMPITLDQVKTDSEALKALLKGKKKQAG